MTIELYRGDSVEYTIRCKRGNQLENITGATLFFTVKESVADLDSAAVLKKDSNGNGIHILDPAKGKAKLTLTPSDTSAITPKEYVYDVQIKTSVGEIYTVFSGTFTLLADVTRRIA